MGYFRYALALFLYLLLFSTCQNDDFQEDNFQEDEDFLSSRTYDNIDKRLWSYWTAFEEEAILRGLDIDLQSFDLVGTIENIEEEHVAGSCSYGGNHPRWVRIDSEIWDELSPIYREFIIFHELGHCILMRDHNESSDNTGTCLSIMRSGLSACRDNYHLNSRDSYLDELFGETR